MFAKVNVTLVGSPNKIIDALLGLYPEGIEENCKKDWSDFLTLLSNDSTIFHDEFTMDMYFNKGKRNVFERWREQPLIYVYSFKHYKRCSDCYWDEWQRSLAVPDDRLVVTTEQNLLCDQHAYGVEGHPCLLSYFYNNTSIREMSTRLISSGHNEREFQKVIDDLDRDKNQTNQEGMFAFKTTFDEGNAIWDENIWSKRLCGGLNYGYNYNGRYSMEYTATKGTNLYHDIDKNVFFLFHGSPDITIKKKVAQVVEEVAILQVATVNNDDKSPNEKMQSSPSDYAAIENSVSSREAVTTHGDIFLLQKTGELLSNMHILLAKKMLKMTLGKSSEEGNATLAMKGMLLCKH